LIENVKNYVQKCPPLAETFVHSSGLTNDALHCCTSCWLWVPTCWQCRCCNEDVLCEVSRLPITSQSFQLLSVYCVTCSMLLLS